MTTPLTLLYGVWHRFTFTFYLTGASALSVEMQKHKTSILSLEGCTTELPDFNQSLD